MARAKAAMQEPSVRSAEGGGHTEAPPKKQTLSGSSSTSSSRLASHSSVGGSAHLEWLGLGLNSFRAQLK